LSIRLEPASAKLFENIELEINRYLVLGIGSLKVIAPNDVEY
jgi:hypothetical protein